MNMIVSNATGNAWYTNVTCGEGTMYTEDAARARYLQILKTSVHQQKY